MLGTKLQVRKTTGGPWRLTLLRLAAVVCAAVFSQPALAQSSDDSFLAAIGDLREASFVDKEALVERLAAGGHAGARSVLAAFLDDRLYYRLPDQKVFIVKSTDEKLTSFALVDPVSRADADRIRSLITSLPVQP